MPALLIACFFLLILFICIVYLIISASAEGFDEYMPLYDSENHKKEEGFEDNEPDKEEEAENVPGVDVYSANESGSEFTTMGPESPKYGYIYKKQDDAEISPVGTLAPTIEFIAPLTLDEEGNLKFPFYNAPSSAPELPE